MVVSGQIRVLAALARVKGHSVNLSAFQERNNLLSLRGIELRFLYCPALSHCLFFWWWYLVNTWDQTCEEVLYLSTATLN